MKKVTLCFTILTVPSLALFFGLFFGLNYPEILRNDWPLTTCSVVHSEITSGYCCEVSCSGCWDTSSLSTPKCSTLQHDNGLLSPSACAANSSACPVGVGGECDNGYRCCSQCCDTCKRCSQSCSGTAPGGCSTTCTSYSCNCRCCNWVNHQRCTLQCPTCYSVTMGLSYTTKGGQTVTNTSFSQDFRKDQDGANKFLQSHLAGGNTNCYYNPKHTDQVLLDVTFTPWKWAVSSVFGIVPLAICILFFSIRFAIIPCFKKMKKGWRNLGNPPGEDENEEEFNRRNRRWLPPVLSSNKNQKERSGLKEDGDGSAKDGVAKEDEPDKADLPPYVAEESPLNKENPSSSN